MATRIMRWQAHPNGRTYWRVCEILSTDPRRERTVASLGADPTRKELLDACREYRCRLPRKMRPED